MKRFSGSLMTLATTASVLLILLFACSGRSGKTPVEPTRSGLTETGQDLTARFVKFVIPEEDAEAILHKPVSIELALAGQAVPDSVKIYFDAAQVAVIRSSPWTCSVAAGNVTRTGRKAIKVTAYGSGGKTQTLTRFIVVYSDIIPARHSYKVLNKYPHDKGAYTQGLVYADGILYEGTGQEAESNLRTVKLTTGEVINQVNLDPRLFGEGIALYGDKIYQVTWRSKVGFVYTRDSFRLLNKVYYQTEGWGLTTMGDKLVMSDGTNVLHIIDPETFSTVANIEVYDNRTAVSELNELEYINGEIWANIYMTDLIARIDPASGKVLSIIDMKGLLSKSDRESRTDVLNGIAYDQATGRIFVTGKYWPWLFEIRITD
ncbi:MAG: glutaminyl-peptide cyclotransferase [Bacteroidales bacterium]